MRLGRLSAFLLGATLAFAAPAFAGDEDDEKKAEKDLKKAEEAQGQKKHEGPLDPREALKKIEELMRAVEQRLADGDTGQVTQAEQKKILEAWKTGERAKTALDELIERLKHEEGA